MSPAAVHAHRPSRLAPTVLGACLAVGAAACSNQDTATTGTPGATSGARGAQAQPLSVPPPSRLAGTGPAGGPCLAIESAGTRPVALPQRATGEVYLVGVQRSACSDKVVFRLNGIARTGADVYYLAGPGSTLRVVVHAPDTAHAKSGHQPWRTPWRAGQAVTTLPAGTTALKRITYAGGSGTRAVFTVATTTKLPFTLTWQPHSGYSELVLEIAHKATA